MDISTRVESVTAYILAAEKHLDRAFQHPDPVEQRRAMVRAAVQLRQAANEADDSGRLTE